VSTADAWFTDAFFDDSEELSPEGTSADQAVPWHAVSPRWGHSMHTMCSYQGMYPAKLAHYFIHRYSSEGDLVVDPFSGRGTTVLQARAEGRRTVGNDLSPLAYVLTRAKAAPPTWTTIMQQIDELEARYRDRAVAVDVHQDIAMLYHPRTLSQLVYLRSYLFRRPMSKWSRSDFMLAGAMAGILHGAHRNDGTSQYLSISMPNTFSMSPSYVEKYIRDNGLTQPEQNVFDCLRNKLGRLYLDSISGLDGRVVSRDANGMLTDKTLMAGSVDLLLTSPPYLDVVNYATANWIRLWWLGVDDVARDAGAGRRKLNAKLDHRHSYESYVEFMRRSFTGARRALSKHGVAVYVIGDVAEPGGPTRPLAEEVWEEIGHTTGLRKVDLIEDSLPAQSKVSRIWGDTKGQATNRDCALVLARADGEPGTDRSEVDWTEPYKDGGPDAAHDRLQDSVRRRRYRPST
jgi:site-specific DNA-methyltransferase (adenine-specific)